MTKINELDSLEIYFNKLFNDSYRIVNLIMNNNKIVVSSKGLDKFIMKYLGGFKISCGEFEYLSILNFLYHLEYDEFSIIKHIVKVFDLNINELNEQNHTLLNMVYEAYMDFIKYPYANAKNSFRKDYIHRLLEYDDLNVNIGLHYKSDYNFIEAVIRSGISEGFNLISSHPSFDINYRPNGKHVLVELSISLNYCLKSPIYHNDFNDFINLYFEIYKKYKDVLKLTEDELKIINENIYPIKI